MLTTTMPKGFFALRLRELRLQRELTQKALAEKADLSIDAIRQFESGRREPGYETLLKLGAALEVSLSAFEPDQEQPAEEKPRKRRPKKD